MRSLWSENNKRRLWRRIWVVLAQVQSEFGLFSSELVSELASHADEIDVEAAIEIESQIHHDLMAELKVFAAQCPDAGGILHMGATSMDIEDNADAIRLLSAMDLILVKLGELLLAFADRIEETVNIPVIAFTHLQPAEPTTLGYRFAFHAQDILEDWQNLKQIRDSIRGKGFKGAVGTGAAFGELVAMGQLDQFENRLSEILDLKFFPITHQTYPRKQDLSILNALSALGASLYKFAFDLRILQSPPVGELSEPFTKHQVGSSAMPFKRNPINAEKIDSLARQLSLYPQVAWQNAANSLLERTLDDSANRRTILPESFLITDEILKVSLKLIRGLNVNQEAIKRNLETYAPFAMTERIMMLAGKKGADRQEIHELLRQHALIAWQAVHQGQPNPLIQNLQKEPVLQKWISPEEIQQLSELDTYVGFAKERTKSLVEEIRSRIQ
jgi:adenylosuccinate lyase